MRKKGFTSCIKTASPKGGGGWCAQIRSNVIKERIVLKAFKVESWQILGLTKVPPFMASKG